MKKTKKSLAVLLSLTIIMAFVFTGCATVAQTTQPETTPTTVPTEAASPAAAQTMAALPTEAVSQQLSYVSIDVNPSIKFTVEDGTVLDVSALNDDGESITLENDVTGLTPAEALNILIGAFADGGFITEEDGNASLVITTSGDDEEELLTSLQDSATQRLTELGLACEVVVSTVEDETVDEAQLSGLTPGRYLLLKYLAEKEGITLEEAKEKYGSLKMGKLVKLVDNVDEAFGDDDDEKDMQELVDSGVLTAEQLEILTQAQNEFKVAMRQAQQVFKQTKTQAHDQWKQSKAEIQNQFKSDKDVGQYKSAKTALKAQVEQQKQTAIQTYKQAQVQAKEQFRVTVQSLGLTEDQMAALTLWDFDFDWDMDYDWDDEDEEDDDKDEDDKDDDEDEDDRDDEEDDEDDDKDDEEDEDDEEDDEDEDDEPGKGNNGKNGRGN